MKGKMGKLTFFVEVELWSRIMKKELTECESTLCLKLPVAKNDIQDLSLGGRPDDWLMERKDNWGLLQCLHWIIGIH